MNTLIDALVPGSNFPRETPTVLRGELAPGIDCYILGPTVNDHRLSKGAVSAALAGQVDPTKQTDPSRYIARIPADFAVEIDPTKLVEVTPPGGGRALTYSATDFVRILTAYTKWFASGTMRKDQEHLGRNAAAVLASFAAAGIVVAIRHACGLTDVAPRQTSMVRDIDQILAAMRETSHQIRDMTAMHATSLNTSMLARKEAVEAKAGAETLARRVSALEAKFAAGAKLPAQRPARAPSVDFTDQIERLFVRTQAADMPSVEIRQIIRPGHWPRTDTIALHRTLRTLHITERVRRGYVLFGLRPRQRDQEPATTTETASSPATTDRSTDAAIPLATIEQVRDLLPALAPTFSRADLGRRLWPHGAWTAAWMLPALRELCQAGEIVEYEGRTRAGNAQARYVVVVVPVTHH